MPIEIKKNAGQFICNTARLDTRATMTIPTRSSLGLDMLAAAAEVEVVRGEPQPQPAHKSVRERLVTLKALYDDGLVSLYNYLDKQRELLKHV